MIGRFVIIVLGLIGAAGFGQGPEIATQYQQRLGGAIDELEQIIAQFDADASKNGLDREQALAIYARSPEPFLRDRGVSMAHAVERYETLTRQVTAFSTAHDFYKPVYLALEADAKLLDGVMHDYTVGLPATASGLLYGGVGGLFGYLFGGLLRAIAGGRRRSASQQI